MFKDFNLSLPLLVSLKCDNQAALHITRNHLFHEKTKHLELDCRFVCEHYSRSFVSLIYVSFALQLVGLFTKSLPGPRFRYLIFNMKLLDLHASSS